MRYTVPIAAEKALELLDEPPLFVHYAPKGGINGFSTATRDRRRPDVLWLNDNAGGARPWANCGTRHCVHIASRAEESAGAFECGEDRSLVVLPHTVSLRRLVTAMEEAFAFYNAWSGDLLDILRRGGDWDELVEAGHRMLQNPMILYNRSMRILAYTVHDGSEDALWTDTVREGVARADSPSRSEDLLRFVTEVERHDAPFRFEGEGMSDPFWCAPVRVGENACGMVNVVEYHKPLSPGDQDLLRHFAEYVAIAMQCSQVSVPMPDNLPRQLMLDLLDGDIPSMDRLNTRLIAVDWAALSCFRSVCLRSELPFLTGEQWRSNYNQLMALSLNGLQAIIDRGEPCIALLLTAVAPDRFDRALEILRQFCAMNHLRAGISDVYMSLLDTPRYFRQAEVALEIGEQSMCFYEQARYGRMLRHLRRHPYLEDLMHPAIVTLLKQGEKEKKDYLQTLYVLISHGFNQVEAAGELGIHRMTLAYRLKRIQEMTGLRLSDPEQVFHVTISLKLLQSIDEEKRNPPRLERVMGDRPH